MRSAKKTELFPIKKDYYDYLHPESAKNQFIKDFVKLCRSMKALSKEDGRGMTFFINKFVCVCGESWQFMVYANADNIWTEATLFRFDYRQNPPADQSSRYPKTKWGDAGCTGRRWDSELREFLTREIRKQ